MVDEVFVYDDDCGFCTWWADYFDRHTDLEILGYSELSSEQRDRLPPDYSDCSHLLTPDEVYSCGASFEQAVLRTSIGSRLVKLVDWLRRYRPYRLVREWGYRWVAHNRVLWGKIFHRTPPKQD